MPPSVEHASVTYRTFTAQPRRGDAVTFECIAGFEVIGFRTAYCKDDGTWSSLPVCQSKFFYHLYFSTFENFVKF